MTLPRLLVFCGFAFAGKDAAADQFVKHDGFVKTYMSKPLERALLTLDPWIADYENRTLERYSKIHAEVGYDESKKNPEVRRLLQTLGTEVGRKQFDEDLWVKLAERDISSEIRSGNNVCLTGVRYPNEMSMVQQFGGVTVWIHRPGVEPVNSHSSEHTLGPDDCDFVVPNVGSLNELYVNTLYSLRAFEAEKAARLSKPVGRVTSLTQDARGLHVEYTLDEEM